MRPSRAFTWFAPSKAPHEIADHVGPRDSPSAPLRRTMRPSRVTFACVASVGVTLASSASQRSAMRGRDETAELFD